MIITRRYTGSWTCGYIAKYNIDDILNDKPIYPVSARGDNDFDNGIRDDEWPVIIVTAH